MLYIVATPIGNLGDITKRAITTLEQVDLIACEDTRVSKKLLQHLGINTKVVSLHSHNEKSQSEKLLQELLANKQIALISDAGTPLISDPGYNLVNAAVAHNIKVVPIPGSCALIAALSVSGIANDGFYFAGFLSAKEFGRQQQLNKLANLNMTIILYEAPHRIMSLLSAIKKIFGGERKCCIAREITKKFETIITAPVDAIIMELGNDPVQQKGEFVVIIEKLKKSNNLEISPKALELVELLKAELPPKKVAKIVGQQYDYPTKDLYKILIAS